MIRSLKSGHLLILLEILVAAALVLTNDLVLGNQVDRGRTADALAAAAESAMADVSRTRDGKGWELLKYYGIDEDGTDGFRLLLPETNMDAAELCVVKCRDEASARAAAAAMKARLEEQVRLFEHYGVEQMKLLNAARVFSTGPYAVLIIDTRAGDAAAEVLRLTGGRAENP